MSCEEICLLRALAVHPENVPESMRNAIDTLNSMEADPTTDDGVTKVIDALKAPVCPVDNCRVSIETLGRYVLSFGAEEPRKVLDRESPPSCLLEDVPHAMDVD